MALNGNVPARISTYDQEKFVEKVDYANIVKKQLKYARPMIPSFAKAPQAEQLIEDYLEKALLGALDPQEAMDQLADELKKFDVLH
jgi:ABC-type glycerol-3-phosphate transport system substrate-binding protein